MKRWVKIDREFQEMQKRLPKMSTFEIKHRLLKIAPELSNDVKNFKRYGTNYSEYANAEYKRRTVHALFGELLKRDAVNRSIERRNSFGVGLVATVTAFLMLFSIGYMNRGEKDKVSINSKGIVTYSNGMKYNGFSEYDLSNIFDYSSSEENNGAILDFLGECLSGYENLIFSNYSKDIFYDSALSDAEMFLKYSGILKLNGVSSSSFYMNEVSEEEWKNLDLCVCDDIQNLCKVFCVGSVAEKYDPVSADNFYKSIYYVKNGNKVYFNSKEQIISYVGFDNEEDFIKFIRDVIYTLNGNVFYCSTPTASEYGITLYDEEMPLLKTL